MILYFSSMEESLTLEQYYFLKARIWEDKQGRIGAEISNHSVWARVYKCFCRWATLSVKQQFWANYTLEVQIRKIQNLDVVLILYYSIYNINIT